MIKLKIVDKDHFKMKFDLIDIDDDELTKEQKKRKRF